MAIFSLQVHRFCTPLLNFGTRNAPSPFRTRRALPTPLLQQQQQQQLRSSSTSSSLRRPRRYVGKHKPSGNMPSFGRLEEPYEHGEDDMASYLKKASLSPWVPVPDVAARKMFDLAAAGPDDIHVDLGSGDGRVNFHAIDYGVGKSIGIDVDETIVQVARDRLAKRHPPPDVEFVVADLLAHESNNEVWEKVQEASIITMYFAKEALEKFRPLLEEKLVGRQCKVITFGYEMPGWQSSVQEVVLGTQIHLYEWGGSAATTLWKDSDNGDDEEDLLMFGDDDILQKKPRELLQNNNVLESQKFQGANIIDRTGKYPIRGYNPDIFDDDGYDSDLDADDEDFVRSKKKDDD